MLKCTVIVCICLPIALSFHHRFRLLRNSSEVLDADYFPMSDDVPKRWDDELQHFVFNDTPATLGLYGVWRTIDKGRFERLQQMKMDLNRPVMYPPAYDIIHRLCLMTIIPYVIDGGPKGWLTLSYRNREEIPPGSGLPYSLIKRPPSKIVWEVEKPYTFYTLIFTRLRTSIAEHSFEKYEQRHNWLVCNIPGNFIRRGQVLIKYHMTPVNQLTNGHFVYLMLVFKQNQKIHPLLPHTGQRFIRNGSIVGRNNFTIKEFLAYNNLYWPLAGFYYYVYF